MPLLSAKQRTTSPARTASRRRGSPVGANIRRARKARGISQEQLADAAGTYRTHVVKWETGHYVPSGGSLQRIAEALEVPVFYFYVEGSLAKAVEALQELLGAGLQ